MSSGLECAVVERAKGKWFYVLESWSSPKGGWDWRDYADCFGPFKTEEAATGHLSSHHANPGGMSVEDHTQFTTDPTWEKLFAAARA